MRSESLPQAVNARAAADALGCDPQALWLDLFPTMRPPRGLEIRTHTTPLYTSMFRADDTLIANPHLYGAPASDNPPRPKRPTTAVIWRSGGVVPLWHCDILGLNVAAAQSFRLDCIRCGSVAAD